MDKEKMREILKETSKPIEEEIVFDLINGYQGYIERMDKKHKEFEKIIGQKIKNVRNNIDFYFESNEEYTKEIIMKDIDFLINTIENIIEEMKE